MKHTLVLLAIASLAGPLAAQRSDLSDLNLEGALALQGYDPVAYFPEGGGQARKGAKERTVRFDGITYRFATEKNRALFLAHPTRFEPDYGGWCAYAMASGDKVAIDPESFLVQKGRLYVFYKSFLANTRKKWLKDADGLQVKADGEWTRISKTTRRDATMHNLGEHELALAGHDPISYFEEGGPTAGKLENETLYHGIRYRFATRENRLRFVEDPTRHEPAFGGWCAYAMSQGYRYRVDPTAFLIQDDRLLVFFREGGTDTRTSWAESPAGSFKRAELNWSKDSVPIKR